MTEVESIELVLYLFAAFPVQTRNVTPEEAKATTKVYSRGLMDLERSVVQKAIDTVVKTSRMLPSVADVRAACVTIAHGHRRPGGDAWGDVLSLIRRYGGYKTPGVDFQIADPLVARAVSAFGWKELCLSENATADRARFIELYESLEDTERKVAQISDGARSSVLPLSDGLRQLNAAPIAQVLRLPVPK